MHENGSSPCLKMIWTSVVMPRKSQMTDLNKRRGCFATQLHTVLFNGDEHGMVLGM